MGTPNTLFEFIKTVVPNKEYNEKEKDQLLQDILTLIVCKLVKIGDDILKSTGKNSHEQFMPPNKKLPAITIKDYLCRLMKYSPCSKECFVSSLLYIDRLLLECGLSINSYNIHRILITTLLISTKYLDDIFYNNEFYSQVGGVSLKEMNTLELDFLKLLRFSAFCPIPLFNEYQKEMESTKTRFLLGPNHPINQTNIITIINKLPISLINTGSPSSSPRNCSPNISTPSSSNQTVPNSPTTNCTIVSSPNINVNSNNGNSASVVPQSNVIINSSSSNNNINNNNNNNSNNSSSNNSSNNSPITIPNTNTGSNSFNNSSFQRRGSCDYETRLPSQTNEKSTFHTNCAA
ncbi:hypothetical protein RB653_000293 [Dictyostelium firmibasis]|uniref:Cyclin-related 2 family protein n=1 Tax=Dictyostelium firmibasis TaxID=79012 RepID=A0AAN7UF62_9MYCE